MLPVIKKIALVLGLILFFLTFAIFSAFEWLQTDSGKEKLAHLIEEASSSGDQKLSIGSLQGSVPSAMVITDIQISDAQGIWLKVDRLNYRWHPWTLVRGKFWMEEFAVQTVDVLRKPESSRTDSRPPEKSESSSGVPIAVQIDRMVVDTIRLGESVLGEEVRLTLNSHLAYLGLSEGLLFDLALERIDQSSGTVNLKIAFQPLSKKFEMDLNAHEPPGGILVRALQVAELPEMKANVKGDGTLENWQGRFDFHAGPALGVEGQATLKTLARETYALDLAMQAGIASFLSPEAQEAWGDSVDVKTRVVSEAFETIKLDHLNISHPAGNLNMAGDINVPDEEMNFHFTLIAGEDRLFETLAPGVHWKSLKVFGTAEGSIPHPTIVLTLDGEGLQAKEFSIPQTHAKLQIAPDRQLSSAGAVFAIKGHGSIIKPTGPDPTLAQIMPEQLTWGLQGNLDVDNRQIDLEQIKLTSDVMLVDFKGQLNEWGEQAKISGTVGLPDLSIFSELAQTELAGNFNTHLDVEVEEAGKIAVVNFSSAAEGLNTAFPEVNAIVGKEFSVNGKARLNEKGLIVADPVEFKGEAISGSLNAYLTKDQKTEANLAVLLPRLAVLAETVGKPISGQLLIRGKTKGVLPSPTVTASVETKGVVFDGTPVEKGRLDLTVNNLEKSPSGTLATGVRVNGLEGTTYTRFALQKNDRLALRNINISGLGAEILGDLLVNLKSTSASGTLNGKIHDFSAINDLLGQEISGATLIKVDLANKRGQTVNFSSNVKNFKMAGDSPLSIKAVSVSAKVTDAIKNPTLNSQLQVSGLEHPSAFIGKMLLTAQGTAKELDFKLATDAKPKGGPESKLKASGRLNMEGTAQELQLKSLAGNMGKIPFELTEPAYLKVAGEDVALEKLSLKIKEGRVSSNFKKNPTGIFGDVAVDAFPLALLNHVVPGFGFKGTLQGKAKLDGNFKDPNGQMKFSVAQLTMDESAKKGLSPAALDLQGVWQKGLTKIDLLLDQPSAGKFKATGEIPLVMASNPVGFDVPAKSPIKASAQGKLGLDILNDFLAASGNQVKGKVDLAVNVSGTLEQPQVTGNIKMKEGQYENLKLGTLLEKMELSTSFNNDQLTIDRFRAHTPKDGTIDAKGTLKKSAKDQFTADLKVNTKSAQLVAIDTVTAQVTSDLHLLGPINSAALKGEIKIDRADIYVPKNLPPSVVVLDVEETNGNTGEGEIPKDSGKKKEPEFDMGLDVKIAVPDQVFVRGRGLDVELVGNLVVTGSTAKPKVDGVMKLRRGSLDLLGRKVKFKQGVVGFDGVPARDPDLDFKAEIPSTNMTILVTVLGAVSNPKFQLSSDPEMPQDEILSNFLFDKSAGSITPLEAVQLANSAAQLAGLGGEGPGLMDNVRGSLGLDTLKFSEGDTGPGVEAGRYVAEGVYIGVKQGLGEDSSGAVLEYEVTPNITVESDIGADANSRLGVSMEWDY